MGFGLIGKSGPLRARAVVAAGTVLSYFAVATATIALTHSRASIAPIWPANAILLALLLRRPPTLWWDILVAGFIGNMAANLTTRDAIALPLLFSALNVVETMIAAAALRRTLCASMALIELRTLLPFVLWAGVVAPLVGGLGGALTAHMFFGQGFLHALETWYGADALGFLVFTPFLTALLRGEYWRWWRDLALDRRIEAVALQLLTAGVAIVVFVLARTPLVFMLFAPVVLVTFRLGRLGTKVAVLIIAIVGALATMRGVGPIVRLVPDAALQAQYLQVVLAVLLLTCLPMSAGLSERAALTVELTQREHELLRQAASDPLTGVLNRSGFREAAEATFAASGARSLWLVAIDVDRFKSVNDRHGHHIGDEALLWVASVLRSAIRHDDLIGRFGGDEFMILLSAADSAEASSICNRLVAGVSAAPRMLGGVTLRLSVSCGAVAVQPGKSFAELARGADRALYEAKEAGRDRVRVLA